MQIDGYSLEVQKTKMKSSCDYNDYEIVGEYENAGKSGKSIGKSIEGRIAFNQIFVSSFIENLICRTSHLRSNFCMARVR